MRGTSLVSGLATASTTIAISATDAVADPARACVGTKELGVVEDHLVHLDSVIGLLVGHPSDREAVSMLEVPGFEGPAQFVTLIAPCEEATTYDPYCDPATGLCSQIACTGAGASWTVTSWIDGPTAQGPIALEEASTEVAWLDDKPAGFRWTSASVGAGPEGLDVSSRGNGKVTPDGASWTWQLVEELPGFVEGATTATLRVTHPASSVGELVADGVVVATVDAELGVTATGECP